MDEQIQTYFHRISLPNPHSHKGQNGKMLLIGGSELFHAASKWSLDIASKFLDMVFYASVPSNNELIQQAKGEFWNGIVIGRDHIEEYITEADCILIGPGMERNEETEKMTNYLLEKYPFKKWMIDAGALQMMNVGLLNEHCIITPHHREFELLLEKAGVKRGGEDRHLVQEFSRQSSDTCVVLKGPVDVIAKKSERLVIEGGNSGMTKGGTGDVLAGLIAALYCSHDAMTAAVVGSYTNKAAGDSLYKKVGPYFNASDLVEEIPSVLWKLISSS